MISLTSATLAAAVAAILPTLNKTFSEMRNPITSSTRKLARKTVKRFPMYFR